MKERTGLNRLALPFEIDLDPLSLVFIVKPILNVAWICFYMPERGDSIRDTPVRAHWFRRS